MRPGTLGLIAGMALAVGLLLAAAAMGVALLVLGGVADGVLAEIAGFVS